MRYLGHTLVIGIGDDLKKLLDTPAPDRRNNPKLGKMGTQRIGYGIQLANDEMPRAMEHQAALLLQCFSLDEPHRRAPYRLADCLSVRGIVLLSFDVRLHLGRRHQPDCVAKTFELT